MPLPARELHLNQVAIQDSYWSPRLAVNSQRAIFHQWQQLEASGCIDNFRILADEKEGLRTGWFFADSDAYKWLEAAARIQASSPSSELAGLMQAFVDLLSRAQSPDGYLFTYNQLHFPGQRWLNLQVEHELYCHGHLIEAGIAHFEATATTRALDLAVRAADLIGQDFLDRAPDYTCGHEEIELALLRLYRAVGNEKYLELARQFLERRGRIRFFSLKLARQFWDHNRRASLVRQQRQAYLRTHPDYQEPLLPPGNYAKKPRAITQRWYLNALSGHYA